MYPIVPQSITLGVGPLCRSRMQAFKIAFTSVAPNKYAAIVIGHVEAGLIQKHYILPLSTPVPAFTCPLQSEALVVFGQWKPTQWLQSSKDSDELLKQTGPNPLQYSNVDSTL